MKSKLTAGAELDMLTKDEVRDVLKSWQTELTRGVKLRRLSIIGTTTAGGALAMGGVNDGPNEGMAWSITRLSVAPGPTLAAAGLQVFANDENSASSLLVRNLATDLFPGERAVVLMSGDSLRITGAGITANVDVTVTLTIKEVPELQIWSL